MKFKRNLLFRFIFLGSIALLSIGFGNVAAAQDEPFEDEGFIDQSIIYGQTVEATITDESAFDFWRFYGTAGDTITITMVGAQGLAPLIGLATQGFTILARSDEQPDGSTQDALPNTRVEITHTISETGEYVINASRAGNINGTTTGSYSLTLTIDDDAEAGSLSQDVTFLCGREEATTAVTLTLSEDRAYSGVYRISVFGLDGFRPVIRTEVQSPGETSCSTDGTTLGGASYRMLDEAEVTLPEEEPENVAQMIVNQVGESGVVVITVGSVDGTPGRFLLLVEGVSLVPAGDIDRHSVRIGPLAASADTPAELLLYAIHAPDTRLDTAINGFVDDAQGNRVACDDAGRRDCADVPTADQFYVRLPDGLVVQGDRLDAGVNIATGSTARVFLDISGRSNRTDGNYYLLLLGELPQRTADEGE